MAGPWSWVSRRALRVPGIDLDASRGVETLGPSFAASSG